MTNEPWSSNPRIPVIVLACFGIFWLLFGRGCGSQQQNVADQPPKEGNTSLTSPDVPIVDTLPQLLTLLENDDAAKRSKAAAEIGAMGSEASSAIDALTAKLSDADAGVRAAAATALGQIDAKGISLNAVAKAAQLETDATSRNALWLAAAGFPAAATAAQIEKQPEIVNMLISGLRGSDANAQAAITKSLNETELTNEQRSLAALYQVVGINGDTNADTRATARSFLDKQPTIAVQQLIGEINDETSPESVRNESAELLAQLVDAVPEADREAVNSSLKTLQFSAITNTDSRAPLGLMMAAENVEHPELPATLLDVVTNQTQPASVRIQAAELIGKSDSPEVAQRLTAALSPPEASDTTKPSAEDQTKLQLALLKSLQRQGSATTEVTDSIAKFANAGSLTPEVQAASLNALMSVAPNSEGATTAVQSALSSDNETVRKAAIKAAHLQSSDRLKILAPALAAIAASGRMADQSEALELLGKIPEAAAPFVGKIATALSEDNDPKIQTQAMGLLSSMGANLKNLPEDQSSQLLAGVSSGLNSDNPTMKAQAAGLLATSGLLQQNGTARDSAVNALADNLDDNDSTARIAALKALAAAGKVPETAQKSLSEVLSKTADAKEAKLAMSALAENTASADQLRQQVVAVLKNDKLVNSADDIVSPLGDKQVGVLMKVANADDPSSSNMALGLMSKLSGTDAGKSQLQKAQKSDDPETRTIASLMLGSVPDDASKDEVVETLASALSMPGLAKETKALAAKLGDDAIGPLTSIASDDKISNEARAKALEMLSASAAKSNDPAVASAALTNVMKADSGSVGTEAAISLATVDPKSKAAVERLAADISKQIPGVDPKEIVAALEHMADSGNGDAIATLGSVITNNKLPAEVKQKAFAAIMSQDHNTDPVKAVLTDLAKDLAGSQGTEAAMALAKVDPKSSAATNRLAAALEDKDNKVDAKKIFKALSSSADGGNKNAIDALASVVSSEKTSPKMRNQALDAISNSDSNAPDIVRTLEQIAKNGNGPAATKAAIALAQRDPKSTIAATQLSKAAASEKPGVPAASLLSALKEMSIVGNSNAPAAIAKLAENGQHSEKAIGLLSQLGDSGTTELAALALSDNAAPAAREKAFAALTQNGKLTAAKSEALKQIASTDKGTIGDQATLALVKSGVAEPKMLERLMSAEGVPQKEALAAIKALGAKAEDALPMLTKLANDNPASKEIQEAIAAVAPKGSNMKELTKTLASNDADATSQSPQKQLTSQTPATKSTPDKTALPAKMPATAPVATAGEQKNNASAASGAISGNTATVAVEPPIDKAEPMANSSVQTPTTEIVIDASPNTTNVVTIDQHVIATNPVPLSSCPSATYCVPVQCCHTTQCQIVGCATSCSQKCSNSTCQSRQSRCRVKRCRCRSCRRCR